MIMDDDIRRRYVTVVHPRRLRKLEAKKSRSKSEELELARLRYYFAHGHRPPPVERPPMPSEGPFSPPREGNPPLLIMGNPERKFVHERLRPPVRGARYATIVSGEHRLVRRRLPSGKWVTQTILHPIGENPLTDEEASRELKSARGTFKVARQHMKMKQPWYAVYYAGLSEGISEVVSDRARSKSMREAAEKQGEESHRIAQEMIGRYKNPRCNPKCDHHGLPAEMWHDPLFQRELRAYKRRHGSGPVEIRRIEVPEGFPRYMSVYGRSPHVVYDAPRHSNKGKRIHHFSRGSKPWLVSSAERGPKFLAYVGGTFRARPDWIYD